MYKKNTLIYIASHESQNKLIVSILIFRIDTTDL